MNAGGDRGPAKRKFPEPGETFPPAEFGWAIYDAVEAARDLRDPQKRLLLRLMRLAGGRSWVKVTGRWLAANLGKWPQRIWEAIEVLERAGYLRRDRCGRRGNTYRFIWRADYQSFLELSPEIVRESGHVMSGIRTCDIRNPDNFAPPPYTPP